MSLEADAENESWPQAGHRSTSIKRSFSWRRALGVVLEGLLSIPADAAAAGGEYDEGGVLEDAGILPLP